MKVKYGLWNGGLVSPLAAPGRKVAFLLGLALLASLASAFPVMAQGNETANETAGGGDAHAGSGDAAGSSELGVPADAPAPAEGKITRVFTLGVIEEGECPGGLAAPCFDTIVFAANPGDVVVLHGDFRNSDNVHNLHQTLPEDGPKTTLAPAEFHTISFVMPEEGNPRVICDVHATTMILDVMPPLAAAAGAAHGESVPSLGVNFLAYWVGVIAFAILFIVYGLTFFLFKYNETRATTDHWDRAEGGAESKRLAAAAPLLAVVIAIAAIAAIIFVVSR